MEPEGPGKLTPWTGTELAALLKRTKAKLEEARGAALCGTGMHKPVGKVHGDQTAESRKENRLSPKGCSGAGLGAQLSPGGRQDLPSLLQQR